MDEASEHRTRWQIHLGIASALIALILALFRADIAGALTVWWEYPAYSHCFLVIPIVAWLIWEKRQELWAAVPSVDPIVLTAALPFSLLWLAGHYASIAEARQYAAVGLVQVVMASILGLSVYRRILFPALFLFFLVPTGEYLIPPLQRFTADFTAAGLTLLHVTYFREGMLFELPNGRYEIAEACAGLRFLIATVTLGVLFCYLMYRKWQKTTLFLAVCVVAPVLGNAIRVLATILVANYTNNRVAAGVDHIVYGWGFAVAIMMGLMFVGSRFRDTGEETPIIVENKPQAEDQLRIGITVALALLAIGLGPAIAQAQLARTPGPNIAMPLHLEHWSIATLSDGWRPTFRAPDRELAFSMRRKEDITNLGVDVVVDYYDRVANVQLSARNQFWDASAWSLISEDNVAARLGSCWLHYSEFRIDSYQGERLVWAAYWADDEFASGPLGLKWLQLKAGLRGHYATAVIALSAPITTSIEGARRQLSAVSAALTDLPNNLAAGETQRRGEPPCAVS
jgi:exosortase A